MDGVTHPHRLSGIVDDSPSTQSLWALGICVSASVTGYLVMQFFDCEVLRGQVSLAVGAIAGAAIIAERWDSKPEKMRKTCVIAAIAAVASAAAALA